MMNKLVIRELLIEKFDKPSVINKRGDMFWIDDRIVCGWGGNIPKKIMGKQLYRRGNKPAIVYTNGKKRWFRNGVEYFPKTK